MTLELVPTMDVQVSNLSQYQQSELSKPLNQSLIRERKGPGGKMLKYIKGSDAIEQANRIFGIGKWGYRVLSRGRETVGDQTFYTADVELYVLGCPFPFPGEGEGVPLNNTVDQHAKARKEAVTDALKRALRHYGDQFGLCLYDEESLVEDNNGNLVPVKDVHSSAKPAPAKPKVVDAVPAAMPQAPTLKDIADLFKQIYSLDKWETFKQTFLGRQVKNADLTEDDRVILWDKLHSIRESSKTNGK